MTVHALPGQLVDRAAAIVRERAGFVVSAGLRPGFTDGLVRAASRSSYRDPARFVDSLETDARSLDDLLGEVVIGETYFMRHPEQFAFIRDRVLPALTHGERAHGAVRLWSAGCATGEEPYSLAILCHEAGLGGRVRILATDVSRRALERARRARYANWSLRGVPDDVRARYFAAVGGEWRLNAGIRRMVEFDYLNLGDAHYPSLERHVWAMDLIVCRNVLIYFDRDTVAAVAARLAASLAPDGWLVLGASDPPIADLVDCETVVTPSGLAYRRTTPGSHGGMAGSTISADPRREYDEWAVPPTDRWAGATTNMDAPSASIASPSDAGASDAPAPAPAAANDDDAGRLAQLYGDRSYAGAATLALALVRRGDAPPATWITLVRSLANAGDLDAAGRHCVEALEAHAHDASLTHLHAVLLCEAGHPREAADVARRALYLDRGYAMAHLALGTALARIGDARGARRSFRNAESILTAMPPATPVPGADGEVAARLLTLARMQLALLDREAA